MVKIKNRYKELKDKIDIAILLSLLALIFIFVIHGVPSLAEYFKNIDATSFIQGGIVGFVICFVAFILIAWKMADENGKD